MANTEKAVTLVADIPADFLCESTVEAAAGGEKLPTFSLIAYTGRPMSVEGWPAPVVVSLDGMDIPSQKLPVRFQHDMRAGVGHTTRIRVDDGRLVAEGVISRTTRQAKDVVQSAKNGFPWQVSIGAIAKEYQYLKERESAEVNGRKFKGPVYVLTKSELGEISFVDLGADNKTSAAVAAKKQEMSMDKDTTDTTPAVEPKPEKTVSVDNEQIRAMQAAAQRRQEINDLYLDIFRDADHATMQRGEAIRAKALTELPALDLVKQQFVEASRPQTTEFITRKPDNGVPTQRVLEAALALAGRSDNPEKHFGVEAVEAAHKRFGSAGIGLRELLSLAAEANGEHVGYSADPRTLLRGAFGGPRSVRANQGWSTIDIAGILSATANKYLWDGFNSVEQTWRLIAATRSVRDFKTYRGYRMTGDLATEELGPAAEIKHGTLEEVPYLQRVRTYAKMLTITREDIVNDDLGAITDVPRKLGIGHGRTFNRVFWTAFLNNAAFFAAPNANLIAGGNGVLSIAGLSAAKTLFYQQTDEQGDPIGVSPRILLVPPELGDTANQIVRSLEVRDRGLAIAGAVQYGVANPHAGDFQIGISTYLSNANIAGSSATAWYLLAAPREVPVIEAAFLNGREAPTVETADADFNVLGISMRAWGDFGVALQEYRGGVKCDGEEDENGTGTGT